MQKTINNPGAIHALAPNGIYSVIALNMGEKNKFNPKKTTSANN